MYNKSTLPKTWNHSQCCSPLSQCAPQEVFFDQFSLYMHKGGLKPIYFIFAPPCWGAGWCSGLSCLLGTSENPGSNPALAFKFQRNWMFIPCSLVKIQYCGDPSWSKSRELGFRPYVSEGQYHLMHLTILRIFSWPSLAYMCTKVA